MGRSGRSKPARRAGSVVCQARQGGDLHARCSLCGAHASMAAAANAQPAALCVVTWVQAGVGNLKNIKHSLTVGSGVSEASNVHGRVRLCI